MKTIDHDKLIEYLKSEDDVIDYIKEITEED